MRSVEQKPWMVVKIGTNVITDSEGHLNQGFMNNIARQMALNRARYRQVLVTSGAITAGRRFIQGYDGENMTHVRKAASFGQPILMSRWITAFDAQNIPVGQLLFDKNGTNNHLETLRAMSEGIPIANADDTGYSALEEKDIKYKDNDPLARDNAIWLGAVIVLYLSTARGLRNTNGEIIKVVRPEDDLSKQVRFEGKSKYGTGGMETKIVYCRELAQHNIDSYIAGGDVEDVITKVARGENPGTHFIAKKP